MQPILSMRAGMRRAMLGGLAAMLVLSFAAFPSVRAAADGILQVFRVQQAMFLPVDASRLQQLASLNFDTSSLFLSSPHITGGNLTQTSAGSVADAAKAVGFQPQQIGSLPSRPDSVEYGVVGNAQVSATLNVETLRSILTMLNITDVTLPDALSQAPITAELSPSVVTRYQGSGYELTLLEGRSPNISMPPGVMLSDLGEAGLRVLGMDAEQAALMSKKIDWTSTLVVPFPSSLSSVSEVQIGAVQGLLVEGNGQGILPAATTRLGGDTLLYWQRGDHFYVLAGNGISENAIVDAARSAN